MSRACSPLSPLNDVDRVGYCPDGLTCALRSVRNHRLVELDGVLVRMNDGVRVEVEQGHRMICDERCHGANSFFNDHIVPSRGEDHTAFTDAFPSSTTFSRVT